MFRVITFVGALALTSSCAGVLELGGKAGKSGDRVTEGGDAARDAADSSGGDGPVSNKGKGKVPSVKTDDDDPNGIQNAAAELDKMEAALENDDLIGYSRIQGLMFHDLYSPDEDVKESSKYKPLLKRLYALDARFAAMAGGHAPEIMGDGKRTSEASEDGIQAVKDAHHACNIAAKSTLSTVKGEPVEFLQAYAAYEKKLARARKVDERALRYAGTKDGFNFDYASDLVTCEAEVAELQMTFEDKPPAEFVDTSMFKACGYSDWVFVALKIGSNKFGPFEINGVHTNNGVAYPCKKFPRKGKVPGEVMQGVKRDLKVKKGEILQMVGGFEVQRDGLDIKKYATVRIYSKETDINKGDCGEGDKDKSIVCEAGNDDTARAYNWTSHFAKRADEYRKSGHPRRCKEMLKKAQKEAEDWSGKHEREVASGDWKAGRKYKTGADGVLSEQKITAAIPAIGEKADERALGGWCEKAGGKAGK